MSVFPRSQRFRALTVSAVAASAVMVALASAPALAFPTTNYDVTYGQTFARGTLTWSNRNVSFIGTDRATGGTCRYTRLQTFKDNGELLGTSAYLTGEVCVSPGGPSQGNDAIGSASANVAGGAAFVSVCLMGKTYSAPNSAYTNLLCEPMSHP